MRHSWHCCLSFPNTILNMFCIFCCTQSQDPSVLHCRFIRTLQNCLWSPLCIITSSYPRCALPPPPALMLSVSIEDVSAVSLAVQSNSWWWQGQGCFKNEMSLLISLRQGSCLTRTPWSFWSYEVITCVVSTVSQSDNIYCIFVLPIIT